MIPHDPSYWAANDSLARNQYNAMLNAEQNAMHGHSALGGLFGVLGVCAPGLGMDPSLSFRSHAQSRAQNYQQTKTTPTGSKIGKITPKPGYVLDWSHPDRIRLKILSDYPFLKRPAVMWSVFKLWLAT